MHRIFKKHWEIFVQRAFNSKDAVKNFYNEMGKFQRNKDLQDGTILHRFPKKELRYFLRAECPTEKPHDKKGIKSYEVIKSAKRLRNFMGISENFVCTRCSKRDTCKFRDTLPKNKETSISDLLIVMNGVYDYRNHLYGGVEEQKEENAGENEEFDEEKVPEVSGDQPQDRYIYKTYDSAVKLIDTLYPVVDDLNMRKGYGSKQYINTYIEENKNLHKNRVHHDFEGESDQEDEVMTQNNKKRSFDKPQKKYNNNREDQQQLSWGARPNKRSFENQGGYKKNQYQPQNERIDLRERSNNKSKNVEKRSPRRFEKEEEEELIDISPKKRDFSSKKNRPSVNDFNDDEEDTFIMRKRGGVQTRSKSFENDNDADEMFAIKKNNNNKFSSQRSAPQKEERPAGGRKVRRNKSESFEGKLNIDSFLHNVKE